MNVFLLFCTYDEPQPVNHDWQLVEVFESSAALETYVENLMYLTRKPVWVGGIYQRTAKVTQKMYAKETTAWLRCQELPIRTLDEVEAEVKA